MDRLDKEINLMLDLVDELSPPRFLEFLHHELRCRRSAEQTMNTTHQGLSEGHDPKI